MTNTYNLNFAKSVRPEAVIKSFHRKTGIEEGYIVTQEMVDSVKRELEGK